MTLKGREFVFVILNDLGRGPYDIERKKAAGFGYGSAQLFQYSSATDRF
jgi:hypothetical protein